MIASCISSQRSAGLGGFTDGDSKRIRISSTEGLGGWTNPPFPPVLEEKKSVWKHHLDNFYMQLLSLLILTHSYFVLLCFTLSLSLSRFCSIYASSNVSVHPPIYIFWLLLFFSLSLSLLFLPIYIPVHVCLSICPSVRHCLCRYLAAIYLCISGLNIYMHHLSCISIYISSPAKL